MNIHEGDADTRKCSEETDEFLVPKIMKEEGLSATSPLQPPPPPRAQTSEFDVSYLVIKRSPISS